MIGNNIADKITSVSNKKSTKGLPSDERKEEDAEITAHKKRYVSPEERQQIIDELRSVYKNGIPKIANLLDNASNQPSKFRTRNWVEINDESRGTCTSDDIKFKTTMLRSNLCDYADAYILVNGRITITGAGDDGAARRADERDKGVTFKNCAPFTKCISRINNTDIDNAQDIDIVMPMYNLIEYSDNYSKTSGSLWQYYKDDPNNNIADSESFKFKVKITG